MKISTGTVSVNGGTVPPDTRMTVVPWVSPDWWIPPEGGVSREGVVNRHNRLTEWV